MSDDNQTPEAVDQDRDTKKQVTGVIRDLQEERGKRHELENEIRALREQTQQFGSLRSELEEWRKSRREREAPPADEYESDPIGYLKKRITEHDNLLSEEIARRTNDYQRNTESDRLVRESSRQVDDWRRSNPDYDDAFHYLVGKWTDEFRAMGLAPSEVANALDNQAMSIMQYASSRRSNPAEMVHKIAAARGFTAHSENDQPQSEYPTHRRLSRGTDNFENLKAIENMSDSEFDKLWSRMSQEK